MNWRYFSIERFSILISSADPLLHLATTPQREAMITERQNKRELAKEAWMLNHQKRKNQQNAGSASKSKGSAAEASSNQDKAAEDELSNARAYPRVLIGDWLSFSLLLCFRPMERQRQAQPRQEEATAGMVLIFM
jgi:hypothetical protein